MDRSAYRFIFALCVSFLFSVPASGSEREDLTDKIVAMGPLSCNDKAFNIINFQLTNSLRDAVLSNLGVSLGVKTDWKGGNVGYEKVKGVLAGAIASDEKENGPLFSYSAQKMMRKAMESKSITDLQFLSTFFSTPEGKLYWDGLIEGAGCSGSLLEVVGPSVEPLEGIRLLQYTEAKNSVTREKVIFNDKLREMSRKEREYFNRGDRIMGDSLEKALEAMARELQPSLTARIAKITNENVEAFEAILLPHVATQLTVSDANFSIGDKVVATQFELTKLLTTQHADLVELRLKGCPDNRQIEYAVLAILDAGAHLIR